MKNGDAIRSMTDEELASSAMGIADCDFCAVKDFCENYEPTSNGCYNTWLDWMKQEED